MKKTFPTKATLITLLMIAAGGAAHAQSTLVIFGIVDAAYSHGSGTTSSRNQLTSGSNSSSRIGFRGSESLGGGMSAAFWLEAQVNADTGAGAPTNTNNQASGVTGGNGLTFGRRSTISLTAPWGELRLGRDFTAHYLNRSMGDVFASVGVGASQPHVGTLGGPVATRASNLIGYHLPAKLGGFYGQAQVFVGENSSSAASSSDGDGYSLRAGFVAGPLNVSAAYGDTQYAAGDIHSTSIAAVYKMKVARLHAAFLRDEVGSPANVTGQGYTLGAVVPAGVGEVKFSLSRYGRDTGARPATRKIALGYVHNLSKRTALYATYARVKNEGGATTALNRAVTGENRDSSGYDLGIRHSF